MRYLGCPSRRGGGVVAYRRDMAVGYGRWRYDPDDAVHDDLGVTWSHGLGIRETQLSLTGAYELVECPTCSGSVMGGIDLESTLLSHATKDVTRDSARTSLAIRVRWLSSWLGS